MRINSSSPSAVGSPGIDDPIDPNQQALGRVVSLAQQMATQLEQDGPAALQAPGMSATLGKLTDALTQLQTASTNGELAAGQQAQLTQILQAIGLADPASAAPTAAAATGHSARDVYEASAPPPGKTHHHHHHGGTRPVEQTDTSANGLGADPSEPK